jgi:hypothetical protein
VLLATLKNEQLFKRSYRLWRMSIGAIILLNLKLLWKKSFFILFFLDNAANKHLGVDHLHDDVTLILNAI